MSKKAQTVFTLGAFALIAWGVDLYEQFMLIRAIEHAERTSPRVPIHLFTLDPDEVDTLYIRWEDRRTSLEKRDGEWWVVSPVSVYADQEEIKRILHDLANLQRVKLIGKDEDLAPYGLDDPILMIRASAGDESQYFSMGDQSKYDYHYYVSNEPRMIHLTDPTTEAPFRMGTFQLRDKRLLVVDEKYDMPPEDIASFTIEYGDDEPLTLRREGPRWMMDSPRQAAGDTFWSNDLLKIILSQRVWDFPLEVGVELEEPIITIRLNHLDGETTTIRYYKDRWRYLAQVDDGFVANMNPAIIKKLEPRYDFLEHRKLYPIVSSRLNTVTIVTPEERIELEKDDFYWEIRHPEILPAVRWKVNAGLRDLGNAEVAEYLPPETAAEHGLDDPQLIIRTWTFEQQSPTFLFGHEKDGYTYIQIEGVGTVHKVATKNLGLLETSLEGLTAASYADRQ